VICNDEDTDISQVNLVANVKYFYILS